MNKYHSVRTTVNGHSFDSKHEAQTYRHLLMMQQAKDLSQKVLTIALQPRFELQESYYREGKTVRAIDYVADFKILFADGHEEVWDAKGVLTDVYKLKKKMLLYKYPDIIFKEIY